MIRQDSSLFFSYLETLKDRFFKILPLFEQKNEGIFKYVASLINELNGLQYVVDGLENDHLLISLIATLESFLDESLEDEYNLKFIRSEVFKCINMINKLKGD